jgi:hypothetical protein
MKLIPMKKYKKRCEKASDERLLKMLNAASQVRNETRYYEAACEEMDRRGLTYDEGEEK